MTNEYPGIDVPNQLPNDEEIEIGPYRILKYRGSGGGFWIGHESGEGMQVSEKALIDCIHKFYEDNF